MPDHPENPAIRLLDGFFYVGEPLVHFRWMREHAPVYWDESCRLWGIALHQDVMKVSKSQALFCSRLGSRPDSPPLPSMINMDDPQHKLRRALVNKGFSKRRVEDHEPKIRGIVTELIDAVCEKGRCDFVREIAAPLPMIVIGDLLGVAPEDRDRLLRWSEEMLGAATATASPELAARAARAGLEYAQYALRVIADRRAKPLGDDLMSVLVHAEIDSQKLDDEALVHESLLILVGGDETTRHVITEGMQALIRYPAERERLVRDPSKIPVAVEEMLRWVSPIKNMSRTATRDSVLRGQKIREGDRLLLLYPSANRDERVFANPDVFDVERSPNDHVAFGGYGSHFCLGASLARLELRVMFEELLRRLPDLELESDGRLPLRPNNFIAGVESMPVVFAPRAPEQH